MPGWSGYILFYVGLCMTALGSSWYHWKPDDGRIVWDRLPIALACAGLLAGEWRYTGHESRWATPVAALLSIASVAWWKVTELNGAGDLGPYLLVQTLPVVLVPVMQWRARLPLTERIGFLVAIFLYLVARLCELEDRFIFDRLEVISGHTFKHLCAAVAAFAIMWTMTLRVRNLDRAGHPGSMSLVE